VLSSSTTAEHTGAGSTHLGLRCSGDTHRSGALAR